MQMSLLLRWPGWLVGLAMWLPCQVLAQAVCPSKLGVQFSDSARGCLSDSPMALVVPKGWRSVLAVSIPSSGRYSLALAPHAGVCPAAVGFAANTSNSSLNFGMDKEAREDRALRECDDAVAAQMPADQRAACKCKVVISDGSSPMPKTAFEERASAAAMRLIAGARVVTAADVGAADVQSATALQSVAAVADAPAVVFRLNSLLSSGSISAASEPLAGTAARLEGAAQAVVLAPIPALPPMVPLVTPPEPPSARLPEPEGPGTPVALVPTLAALTSAAGSAAPVLTVSSTDLAALRSQLVALQQELAKTQNSRRTSDKPVPRGLRAYALVVGNTEYRELTVLPNAIKDARAIAAKLRSFGMEVELVTDSTRSQLLDALRGFNEKSRQADIAVFFYAGHGLQLEGINFLASIDLGVRSLDPQALRESSVTLNDVLKSMSAPTRLVFLDACRDNPVSGAQTTGRPAWSTGLAPISVTSGTLISYATRDGSTAEDGVGSNSPYSTALLQHLDAEEDIAIVLRRVRQTVLASTMRRQEPWEYGSLVGDAFVLSQVAMR